MKTLTHAVLTVTVFCFLFLSRSASAQDSVVYSTVDYDEETNTVYGYAYTFPDYSAQIYYSTTGVGGSIKDADGNTIDMDNQQLYGRAQMYLEGSGTGSQPYSIYTGHYVRMSYYVYNYYDPYSYGYRTGYLDYYYYYYYTDGPGGPVIDIPIYFDFIGRSPHTVTSSVTKFLGTLLTSFIPSAANNVRYKTVTVDSVSRDFNDFSNSAEFPLDETARGADYCHGGASTSNAFTVTLTFNLPDDTTHVFEDSRSFVSESDQQQFIYSGARFRFSNLNLSGQPKSGQVSFGLHRKRPASDFPDTKVKVTIAGRRSGGTAFSNGGRIKFTCP